MANVNKKKFEEINIILPSDYILQKFTKFSDVYFYKILNLQRQNQKLQEARDALLPRLMSGAIDV